MCKRVLWAPFPRVPRIWNVPIRRFAMNGLAFADRSLFPRGHDSKRCVRREDLQRRMEVSGLPFRARNDAQGRNMPAALSNVESLTRAYGQEIFARVEHAGPILFAPGWWDERLMEWTMGDEAVKLQ